MRRTLLGGGAALLLLLAPSGCGVFRSSKPAAEACPAAIILRSLANTAVFAPGKALRPENVAFYGILDEVDRNCEDISPNAVRVRLTIDVIGQRGPAARGDAVDFQYFVAVTAPGERVLVKQPLTVRVTIPPDRQRAGVTDQFEEVIPLAGGYKPGQLTLDLGFQQSPEIVDFYRHFRGR
ncbi:MAG TPA: hypothetical protein VJ770_29420 [Stellaceae bacterium]|nr:hypothetical protein [Stellaceae bacterium]